MCFCSYLSLVLGGFQEKSINHCDSVSLNVLIRPEHRQKNNTQGHRSIEHSVFVGFVIVPDNAQALMQGQQFLNGVPVGQQLSVPL